MKKIITLITLIFVGVSLWAQVPQKMSYQAVVRNQNNQVIVNGSIGLRIKETKEVWEGEVVEITPEEVEDPHGGYGKVVQSVIVGLKTTKGQK